MRALVVSGDRFEDSELLEPAARLRESGSAVDVASTAPGTITGKHGRRVPVDRLVGRVAAVDYDLLLLPGGEAPEDLCRDDAVLQRVRDFVTARKPVAAICHGPLILAAAGVLAGRRMTGHRTVADALRRAGAEVEDREVVVDDRLVTSRRPADLPAFIAAVMRLLGPTDGTPPARRQPPAAGPER